MLVLSRRLNETVRIGEDIEVQIVDIRGDRVRLGITAPVEVPVHREEVYVRRRQEAGSRRRSERTTSRMPRVHANGDVPVE